MIRRYYILPLRPLVTEPQVRRFIDVLNHADRFIPGLKDSSAGLDVDSRTVVWENTFVDEASYSGPYMVHPYHIGAIDDFVMADSPENLAQDCYATRFVTDDASQPVRNGLRRLVLLNVDSEADADAIASIAGEARGMAVSRFGADTVGWVSAKGRAWTHIWEQVFTDADQLNAYLATRDGVACSSREGLVRLGVHLSAVKVFTCPLELAPGELQSPPPAPPDRPVLYTIVARTALDAVDTYIAFLEKLYDTFMASCGALLAHRARSIASGYTEGEVTSTWRIESLAAYCELRAKTYADPAWNDFVRDAMPLVRGGTRRFHHAI